jgi:hypothetical protein
MPTGLVFIEGISSKGGLILWLQTLTVPGLWKEEEYQIAPL